MSMFLLFFGIFIFPSGSTGQFTNVDDYIDVVTAYYRHRNTRILTQFTCFSQRKIIIFLGPHKLLIPRIIEVDDF